MTPRLKDVAWERDGAELRVVYDRRNYLMIGDRDGTVERLLVLLRDGGRTVEDLAAELSLPAADVAAAVDAFDEHRLLEDTDRCGALSSADRERYFSNLAFFESFASLRHSREDFQQRLRNAHVLVLGTGGLNSNTIPHLCGLGVGRLTLLDRDVVEPRNFARQYLYRSRHIGARKAALAADWVRSFDPAVRVEAIDTDLTSAEQVAELVARLRPDVVAAGVDRPAEVDLWVNAACVPNGVPFVRGGMGVTTGTVWSVAPGHSACRACMPADPTAPSNPAEAADTAIAAEVAAARLYLTKARPNRGIGPVAGLLGSLAAFELLRYLTGFEPPAYAGRPLTIDFAGHCAMSQLSWPRNPECDVCGGR